MLSIPHMIVVFLVVLVVFGPQKLPELARSFGKLMAEFRKASNDFKNAFEEEMRDLERQARIAELKKQVAEANAAADAATRGVGAGTPPPPASSVAMTPLAEANAQSYSGDFPVVTPAADSVPRSEGTNGDMKAPEPVKEPVKEKEEEPVAEHATETRPSHDQQQPA